MRSEGKPSMAAKANLDKRIERLRDRIRKAGEASERPLPPDGIRRFRKRLKRTQRKLAKRSAREEKAAKSAPNESKSPEPKAPEAKTPEEPAQA